MDRFLIFAAERSGSTSLAAALNLEYSMVQEPFSSLTGDIQDNPVFFDLLSELGQLPEDLPDLPDEAWGWNRFHAIAEDRARCRAYLEQLFRAFTGVKHVWNTVSRQANYTILEWCLANDIRIILLTRSNQAQALLSRFLAEQANIHNFGPALEGKRDWQRVRFQPIDVAEFREQLEELKAEQREYVGYLADKPHFSCTYEQLYQGWRWRRRRTLKALCRFISTSMQRLDQDALRDYMFNRSRKQTRSQTLDRLPNADELRPLL